MKVRWLEERTVRTPQQDAFKVGVSGVSVQITQMNSKTFLASFYLRILHNDNGRETLGERLNDPAVNFLPCKIDDRTELLNLSMISHVRAFGALPEIELKEQLGAIRQPARVTMESGYTFTGEFIYIQPSARARLSDLLNCSTERFLLFLTPTAPLYLHRDAITRLVP